MLLEQIRRFFHLDDGAIFPLAAIIAPALVGVAGIGVDTGFWMAKRRDLQTAADAAAVAAAFEASRFFTEYMEYAALREAMNNGYDPGRGGQMDIDFFLSQEDKMRVSVRLEEPIATFFSSLWKKGGVNVAVYAEAEVVDVDGKYCLLSLDPKQDNAISVQGTAEIHSKGCGLAVNSSSLDSLTLGGGAEVHVGRVRLGGDYDTSGNVTFDYDYLFRNTHQLADPYADLDIPDFPPCSAGEQKKTLKITESTTLSPGVYCGGIDIGSTNDVVFKPGIYIIDGGDFKVNGGGSLHGEGVTFILTDSHGAHYGQVDVSGNRTVYLSAPREGEPMEGVVFYQDRNAPDNSNLTNKLTGSSELVVDGVVYMPSQQVEYGGGHSTRMDTCNKVIAKKITLSGNPLMNNDCSGKGTQPIGPPKIALVR